METGFGMARWELGAQRSSIRLGRHFLQGDDAEEFEHHRRSDEPGHAPDIERRRLDDVGCDSVDGLEPTQHLLRLADGDAADFRRAGACRHQQ